VATFHIDYQRVESAPPYPSVIFHAKTSPGSPCVAEHYPNVIRKYSGVSSNSAAVKATNFVGPHKSHMLQYTTQCLLQHGTTDMVLNQHKRGLPLWSSKSDIRPLSSFPSSILYFPLVAPPKLLADGKGRKNRDGGGVLR
jgi:hypothetical protein